MGAKQIGSAMVEFTNRQLTLSSCSEGEARRVEKKLIKRGICDLKICHTRGISKLPCVSFLRMLKIECTVVRMLPNVSKAIRKMPLLDFISVWIVDDEGTRKENVITKAIAAHPSITKVCIGGRYGYGIETVVKKNKRINEYVIKNKDTLYPECGDIFAKTTHIKVFVCKRGPVFRDGVFAEFLRNNVGLRKCTLGIRRLDDVVALRNTSSIRELSITCTRDDISEEAKDVAVNFYKRCRPREFYVDGAGKLNYATEAFCVIDHDELPNWNFKKANQISDAAVTCHDLP